MNLDLIRSVEKKENKSKLDWTLLAYHKTLAIISEILVSESKLHLSSEEAIEKIRNCMNDNL